MSCAREKLLIKIPVPPSVLRLIDDIESQEQKICNQKSITETLESLLDGKEVQISRLEDQREQRKLAKQKVKKNQLQQFQTMVQNHAQPCDASSDLRETLNSHSTQIQTLITGHEGYKNRAFELLEEQKTLANDQKTQLSVYTDIQKNQADELLRLAEQIALLRKDDLNIKDALTQGHKDLSNQASKLQRDVSRMEEASKCREIGMHRIDLLRQEVEGLREEFAELSAACREAFDFKELWVRGEDDQTKLAMIKHLIKSKLDELLQIESGIESGYSDGDFLILDEIEVE